MKKHRKLKKNVKIALIGIILCILVGSLFFLKGLLVNKEDVVTSQPSEVLEEKVLDETLNEIDYHQIYLDNKAINDDYIGIIKFESEIVNLPFVQSQLDNVADAYLEYERKDWKTGESFHEGSIFMDPNNKLDDQNIVLYGHYVYPQIDATRTHKFTPLHILRNQELYEENKMINLYLENEVRKYQVCYVYYADIITDGTVSTVPEGMEYMRTNFTEEELNTYLGLIQSKLFYDTGLTLTTDDKFLTLQTCVQDRDNLRLIIVAKEVAREAY